MAQDPLFVDQVRIEPGTSGTRLIRKATDGSLEFVDPSATLTLKQLAGLRNIGGILVVGKSGAGAAYSSIQSALDAIPVGASATSPYYVIIGPGVYNETLSLVRDGVTLIGYGAVLEAEELVVDGPAADHTLSIYADLGSVPKKVTFINLEVNNIHTNYAAVYVEGGAASTVAQNRLLIQDCQVRATGSGWPLKAVSVNHIVMQGGSMVGSNAAALVVVEECASFLLDAVSWVPAVQFDFDTGGDIPSEAVATSYYKVSSCTGLGESSALNPAIASTLQGRGSLEVFGCSGGADSTFSGDRSFIVQGSKLGDLTLNDSVAVSLTGSSHGTVTAGGTATLEESVQTGAVAFAGDTSKAVVFDAPNSDALYTVSLELDAVPASNNAWWITGKTAAGFTINFTNAQTLGVTWTTHRVM